MFDILTITGPIYILILSGFIATRFGMFDTNDMRVLGKFVLNFALPALIFRALSQRPLEEVLNAGYLLSYSAGSLTMLGLGYFWSRRLAGRSSTASTFYAMGMTCSNSGFVGYPILLLTMAPIAGVSLALNMLVENLVMIPLVLVMAEHGRAGSGRWYRVLGQALSRLVSNPLIIALIAGFCISLANWRLPAAIVRTVDMFAMASGAVSLFVVGGTLVGLAVKGMGRQITPIVVGKLILHPLAVFLAIWILTLLGIPISDPSLRKAAVLMAAMPMMSIYTILAQAYGQQDFSAPAMLVATVTSFFTLSGLLFILRHFPMWG